MTKSAVDQVRAAVRQLADSGVPSPRNDAEVLAAHLLGIPRSQLATAEPAESFSDEYAMLVRRRAEREPLQHITGEAPFRRLTLQVGPGVFIPRPESELTAGAAIEAARAVVDAGRVPVVVDLFAGSGAIAISVAREVRPSMVHAVESEDDAVQWLRRNAAGESLVVHHDDVAGIVERSMSMLVGTVDVVVANPPYVPLGATIRDPEVAGYDPVPALWSGADGLDAMRTLESVAVRLLRGGGVVVAEHGDEQGASAPAVFSRTGHWTAVTDHHDLNDRPRYLTAYRRSGGLHTR